MRSLADSGIIERRRKGGTIVRRNPITRAILDIPVTRLEIEQSGSIYGYHMIECRRLLSPVAISAVMELAEREEMLNVKALHLSDGRPYLFEDRWISLETVPEISGVDLKRQSANEWLVYNRPFSRCSVQIFAHQASKEDAAQMLVEKGSALLVLERTTWINDAPITHVQSITAPGYRLSTSG